MHRQNLEVTRVVGLKDGKKVLDPDYSARQCALEAAWTDLMGAARGD